MKAIAGVLVMALVVLGAASGAGATSAKDKKEHKAFLANLNRVQLGAVAFVKTATRPDPSDAAMQAPCTKLGKAVAEAHATKRPKRVPRKVWSHVTSGYAHYKAAVAFCLQAAPGTSNFADAIHEYGLGSHEIAQVQAALHR
jgi:hypothetical protein